MKGYSARTVAGKVHKPTAYGAVGAEIMLTDVYPSEEIAQKVFSLVDFTCKGSDWTEWSVDAAAIMQAYEKANGDAVRTGEMLLPGVLEFDPGIYYVSMGHVWFHGTVNIRGGKNVVLAGIGVNSTGNSPTWRAADYGLGTVEAAAVLTVGYDVLKPWVSASGANHLDMELPAVWNQDYYPYRPLHLASGSGYRFLYNWDCDYRNVSYAGPFKYGIIFCANTGSAYSRFHLGKCSSALVAFKWRSRTWNNSTYFFDGEIGGINAHYLYDPVHSGHDHDTAPTTLIDANNETDNPNDPAAEHSILDEFSGGNHYEWHRTQFESNDYIQFWRIYDPSGWKFHNIRLEGLNRPSLGAGGRIWKRQTMAIAGSAGSMPNEFIDNFDNSHLPYIPLEYIRDGSIEVTGRGLPSGHNYYGQYRPVRQQFSDLSIDRAGGGIILYDESGNRRFINYMSGSEDSGYDWKVQQLPCIQLYWRQEGAADTWQSSSYGRSYEDGDQINMLIRISGRSGFGIGDGLYLTTAASGYVHTQINKTLHAHRYTHTVGDFEESAYTFGDEDLYGFTNYELKSSEWDTWSGSGQWTIVASVTDTTIDFNNVDNTHMITYPNAIEIDNTNPA